jgi:hypothetical protein
MGGGAAVLQTAPQSPSISPPGPTLSDIYERQALGRLQGPAAQQAKEILSKLAEIAKDTAEREAVIAADEAVSAGTAAGPDEVPILGEGVMGAEAAVGAYEAYKIAQNAKKMAELLALLAVLARVQIQEETKRKRDCGSGPKS